MFRCESVQCKELETLLFKYSSKDYILPSSCLCIGTYRSSMMRVILLLFHIFVLSHPRCYEVHALAPESSASREVSSSRLQVSSLVPPPPPIYYGNANDRRKESLAEGNNPLISLNLNLDAMAQSGAAPRAQELLQRIHALYQEGYYEVSPDTVSYNSVLKAWKEENNPEKAYELLQDMLLHQTEEIQVDVISLNTVILAFAKTGNYPQAEELLRQMQERDDLPDPDIVTFNSLLYAFSVSPDPSAAVQAENLLKEMMSPRCDVAVDTTSFNTVIFAWSQVANSEDLSPARRAQQLLEHIEQLSAAGNSNVDPDVYSYTTVIQAWARSGQSVRAQKILDRMTARGLVPNRFTYTAVMSALAKSGIPQKAEDILDEMMVAYNNGNTDLKPCTVAFSAVMDGWARLSNVDKPEAATRALALLNRMKELESEGMGPNARTYTSVFTALAKSGTWEACEKARDLLQEMEKDYKDGQAWLRPSVIQYNAVLLAFARSPRADKALKAAEFMKLMSNHPDPLCRPDTITLNTLLMACANAFGSDELKTKSFRIASDTFRNTILLGADDTSAIGPTSTTFVHFCKAARRLISGPPQRHLILRKVLLLCCEKGLLNHVVVQQAQLACQNAEEWSEMAGDLVQYIGWKGTFQATSLPPQWVCNARR